MQRVLLGLHINRRLAATASLTSIIVMVAGAFAMLTAQGVFIASVLLTVAFLVGVIGVVYANDRTLGVGIAALIAAALPLFLILQGIGLAILRRMGPDMAGGLLIAIGGVLAGFAIWLWLVRNALRRTFPR